MVGGLEIVLVVAILVAPLPNLLLGLCMWKMATEVLFMASGSLPFEWIERAGSYMAPLALYYLMVTNREKGGQSWDTAMVLYGVWSLRYYQQDNIPGAWG
jgi:hypothetical protein